MWQSLLGFMAGVLPMLTQAAKTIMAFLAGETYAALKGAYQQEHDRANALQSRADVEEANSQLSDADILKQLRLDTERRKKPRTHT